MRDKLIEGFWTVFVTVVVGTIIGVFLAAIPALYNHTYIREGDGILGVCISIALYSVYGIVQTLRRK